MCRTYLRSTRDACATRVLRKYVRHIPHLWRSYDEIFSSYYRSNRWNDKESRSGSGSSLEATEKLRAALPPLLADLRVRSIVDVPCGDFHWMKHVELGSIGYTGVDVVATIVAENNRLYARGEIGRASCRERVCQYV